MSLRLTTASWNGECPKRCFGNPYAACPLPPVLCFDACLPFEDVPIGFDEMLPARACVERRDVLSNFATFDELVRCRQ